MNYPPLMAVPDIRLCGEIELYGEKKMEVAKRVFVCPVSVD
jgi:hypothetical protein